MMDFWRDLVVTAIRNMTATLGAVMPSILAMLTLVALGALLGWISARGRGASRPPWPAPASTARRPRR